MVIVTAVAEGLVGGGAAAAERDDVAPAQAEGLAGGVQDLQGLRSFSRKGPFFMTVILTSDIGRASLSKMGSGPQRPSPRAAKRSRSWGRRQSPASPACWYPWPLRDEEPADT